MRRIGLIIGYDGTRYAGWQRQENGLAIQQVIEDMMLSQFHEKVDLMASGRTDAGVHARGQVAAMDLKHPIATDSLVKAMNSNLPEDIRIYRAFEAPSDFQPRFDAKQKTYGYRFFVGNVMPPEYARYADHVYDTLDVAGIPGALARLVGEHDFLAFRASGGQNLSTVRTIYRAELKEEHVEDSALGKLYRIDVTGNGFLYKMVRTIAGTALAVAKGAIEEENITRALESKDKKWLGPTAPAKGLMLLGVEYEKIKNFT